MEDARIVMDAENRKTSGEDQPKKSHKRRRESSAVESLNPDKREAQMKALEQEMEGLFRYYEEMMGKTADLLSRLSNCSSVNAMVAVLIEERSLPLSKLVDEIYPKVKEKVDSVTLAAVKSAVVFVGQRVMYGVPNPDADVLEDDTDSCLWCWETRDLKVIPKSARGMLKIRRTCRKKIHERISAVSAMIAALRRAECDISCRNDLSKAAEKLGKVLSEADIRLFVDNMLQKNSAEMVEKDARREQKMLIKQLERTKREAEKEKKRMDREIQKERLQYEKEQKRLQEEAEKDEKHKEKEESELRKRLKKQQDDAEREQKRREKEQAEQKKQLALQKQASIMERFLKRNKNISFSQNELPSGEATALDSSSKEHDNATESVIDTMDRAFATTRETSIDDLCGVHFSSWRQLGHSIRSSSKQHWGMRRKPKVELFPEIKLSINRGITNDNELSMEKPVDTWEEKNLGGISCISHCNSLSSGLKKSRQSKQLLQFDKSYRPAFYGIWPNQSQVVGPRHPLKKDPDLDYDIDSDEEWEEEEPGESLSDCEKDEEECLEEGCSNADDEDDSEDGFFVPDGYLSEDEGVWVDRMDIDPPTQDVRSSPTSKQEQETEEFRALLRQQKHLHSLTEHALKKSQPLIICNLMHERAQLLAAKDLDGTLKLELMCLQALTMRTFPGSPLIEISINNTQDEDQEVCESSCSYSTPPPTSSARTLPDSDLLSVVSIIRSCSQGIHKVVETLQQKFPDVSKTQLRNKVREISEYEDNRWQVKKEILAKLGLSSSPDKVRRTKSISSFFSKRCLPPSMSTNPIESPQTPLKPRPAADEPQECKNDLV